MDVLRQKYEKRIEILNLNQDSHSLMNSEKRSTLKKHQEFSLNSILQEYKIMNQEKNFESSSSLFYFLNFMDQQQSIPLLKLWFSCEKMKNSLDHSIQEENEKEEEKEKEKVTLETSKIIKQIQGLSTSLSIEPRILNIFTEYESLKNQGIPISCRSFETVCRSILKTKTIAYDHLELNFNSFLESELYFKLVSENLVAEKTQKYIPLEMDSTHQLDKDPKEESNSSILAILMMELSKDSSRLIGSHKIKTENEQNVENTLFISVDDVLDVDLIANINESEPLQDLESKKQDESFAPGEILKSSTKLQQIKQDISCLGIQIDIINSLFGKLGQMESMSPSAHHILKIYIIEQTLSLLKQEMNELTRQKVKYETQEQKDAITPGTCTIYIHQTLEDYITNEYKEQEKVTFYDISVKKESGNQNWHVKRRYNDFYALHKKLKEKFPVVNEFDLPAKTLGGLWSKLGKEELKRERRLALERYLQVFLIF